MCDDVRFVVVGEVVECGNMFRGEHEAGIEGADEVCGVDCTWVGLDVLQGSSVAVSKER